MNKLITLFLSLAIGCSVYAQTPALSEADYCMKAPIGYGRNATGGDGGPVVTVATHTELRNALRASGKSIIIVTQDIAFGEGAMIGEAIKDKTLLGLKGVKLVSNAQVKNGGILNLKAGSSNVIIRNLIFEGPGAYDVDGNDLLSNTGCLNLWVDHCEFYDGVDGNFDNTNSADNVTISWCKFGYKQPPKAGGSGGSNDHRFTNLVGGSSSAAPTDKHYSITFQYCYWSDGCRERMPRARNAELHILNCYYNTDAPSSLALGLEGGINGLDCYVEGSHFKQIKSIYKDYGTIASQTLAFVDCLAPGALPAAIGQAPRPTYSYSAIASTAVEEAVTGSCGAGATLDVTVAGDVSSVCSSGTAIRFPKNTDLSAYYDSGAGEVRTLSNIPVKQMKIYSAQGAQVGKIRLPGVYIAHISLENKEFYTSKIIVGKP